MRAVVRSLTLDPDPRTLPDDPARFGFLATLMVGSSDGDGEESFSVWVCTPEAIAARCEAEGFVDGRHTVVTTLADFSEPALREFLVKRVENASGESWDDVAQKVARVGLWEFEDHPPSEHL